MRARTLLSAALAAAALTPAAPASATDVGLFATGGITVNPDLSACATVSLRTPSTFAGSFTAEGALTGPGTIVAPVAGAVPVSGVNTTTWYRCLPGGYAGATLGEVTYTFHVSSVGLGDYVAVVHCSVRGGAPRCI
jgi:hypothetical protein